MPAEALFVFVIRQVRASGVKFEFVFWFVISWLNRPLFLLLENVLFYDPALAHFHLRWQPVDPKLVLEYVIKDLHAYLISWMLYFLWWLVRFSDDVSLVFNEPRWQLVAWVFVNFQREVLNELWVTNGTGGRVFE